MGRQTRSDRAAIFARKKSRATLRGLRPTSLKGRFVGPRVLLNSIREIYPLNPIYIYYKDISVQSIMSLEGKIPSVFFIDLDISYSLDNGEHSVLASKKINFWMTSRA